MLSRDKAARYLDTILQVLHVINDLTRDKLFPAEVALAGVKAALESLDDDKIADLDPDEIRAMASRLKADLAKVDAAIDAKLKAKFDTSDTPGTEEP